MRRPLPQFLAVLVLALALAACTTLPPGVAPAPQGAPDSAVLTLPSGRDVAVNPDALRYTGTGRLRRNDGRVYDGAFVDGRAHGPGIGTRPDGTVYQGEWQDGRRHGQGELRLADGGRYRGGFHQGARQGQGTLTGPDGVYRGGWVADLPHGQGTFDAPDGTRYEGEWRHGQRFGQGHYTGARGGGYEGDWANDEPHGFGRLDAADGTYQGAWRQGARHGYGRSEGPPGLIYEGTWVDGKRQGFGREWHPDGSSYAGFWRAGERHGQGREVRADGSFHHGRWEHDRTRGPGRRRTSAGIEISGVWHLDQVAAGMLELPTGMRYAGPLFGAGGATAAPALLDWLAASAGQGDPYAQLLLGTLRLDLREPPPDLVEARRWLGRAADAGIAEAQFRLALTYEQDNPPRVVDLLHQAARQGHAGANDTLGDYFYAGTTVPRNIPRAMSYYEAALAAGSLHARHHLAWLLATAPEPGARDPQRAVTLIRPIALWSGAWQYLDTLAAARAAAGEFSEAVRTARRALAAAADDPTAETGGEREALARRLEHYRRGQPYTEPQALPASSPELP